MFKIHGAPESPHEGKCLRYIMNRSRKLGYMVFSCLQVITVFLALVCALLMFMVDFLLDFWVNIQTKRKRTQVKRSRCRITPKKAQITQKVKMQISQKRKLILLQPEDHQGAFKNASIETTLRAFMHTLSPEACLIISRILLYFPAHNGLGYGMAD